MVTSLSQKPDYLKAVGLITAEWTAVEHQMLTLFAILANCGSDVAAAIFSAIESNRGRREIILSVAKVTLRDNPDGLLKEVEALLDRTRKAVSKRNRFAHALWSVSEDGTVATVTQPPIVATTVTVKELEQASDQMARLQHDFVILIGRFYGFPASPKTP